MVKLLHLLVFVMPLILSCEDSSNNDYGTLNFDMRLDSDANGFYHLSLNKDSWQTLHRVSAIIKDKDEQPVENFWMEWDSNLYWYLGDTLGYVIKRGFDYPNGNKEICQHYDCTYSKTIKNYSIDFTYVPSVNEELLSLLPLIDSYERNRLNTKGILNDEKFNDIYKPKMYYYIKNLNTKKTSNNLLFKGDKNIMVKKALITGVTGQDGSYLLEILLEKGYEVHGLIRRSSSFNTGRIDHIINDEKYNDRFFFHHGDLTDASGLNRVLEKIGPNEIYNLAAQSHVKVSFDIPDYTTQVDALGTLRILESILKINRKIKFYQASTSELFGKVVESPQNEKTPFNPQSPYAVAKLYSYWTVKNYRQAYNIHASNGILFNHESPRRGETFVTQKIVIGACNIKLGIQDKLVLGNLNAKRDWGYAPEYVEGMWRILQHKNSDDYVLATGQTYSIKYFVEKCFQYLGIKISWIGSGINEHAINKKNNKKIVVIDKKYFRPNEVDLLVGDSRKANKILKWKSKTSVDNLIKLMIDSKINELKKV
mgnify:CR=1 FL=1